MTTIASIKKQLAALLAVVKPAHSLAAKLDTFNEDDRARYDLYSERLSAFIARNDVDSEGNAGNAYAMTLRGYGPRLPETVSKALFGKTPEIVKTDTDDDAACKWMEYLNDAVLR
ncbi:hypothetical protein [Bradyrhizobium japonicum]|uniref:hypothetical protein n=1 Tax=Bradyrhizobium japonicum TaxID=375 RepID=UPI001E2AEDAF|nr:hypothetical protein [Bradyrhizobium japonicum]MCD9825335.1 hypothetical protein [Bradyrhizobium japonicum]MCD9898312.1 hypothetical protein [Bradyrhizobium japonicum]MCP1766100.1 hypothetical protein [Bradyrhizobium japonicum]MCP1788238.1 hypothetical protein [Bradyrhizobium japonicum]MCP1810113.1 hypothetical protein [Bradyrhizobium japonicum]